MAFIEKNKTWLLPLLGLGILGVGYLNFRTLRADQPPTEKASIPPDAALSPDLPGAAPSEPGNLEGTQAPAELWRDLKPFAILPGALAQDSVLTDRARVALGAELDVAPSMSLEGPAWASLAAPVPKPAGGGDAQEAPGDGPPELDFLVHGPQGSRAWFGGRAYRAGEKLLESGYTLSRIAPTFVELTGPRGKVMESTNPILEGQTPSHPMEMP